MMKHSVLSLVIVASGILFMNGTVVYADPRTESICNLGMVKGEQGRTCEVPIPSGCKVANFPGHDDPWVDISKGGKTSCVIDEKQTDWTTKIVGSCSACGTDNCSARFSVMFACDDSQPMTTQPRKVYKD